MHTSIWFKQPDASRFFIVYKSFNKLIIDRKIYFLSNKDSRHYIGIWLFLNRCQKSTLLLHCSNSRIKQWNNNRNIFWKSKRRCFNSLHKLMYIYDSSTYKSKYITFKRLNWRVSAVVITRKNQECYTLVPSRVTLKVS